MNFLQLVIFLGLAVLVFARRKPEWDGLRVTWGQKFGGKFFDRLPRTACDAEEQGFVKISDCDSSKTALFRGQRYMKDNDETLILLYDIQGYIAGIQTGLPSGLPNNYPSKHITPPFTKVDGKYYLTAYFVPPDKICSKGRTALEFHNEGTGSILLIQNGTNPDKDVWEIPLEEEKMKCSKWRKSTKCVNFMGMHYWYDVSKHTSCDKMIPLVLMFNNKKLNAFGWTFNAYLNSSRVEHPRKEVFKVLFKNPPDCMFQPNYHLTTMHIYLSDNMTANQC